MMNKFEPMTAEGQQKLTELLRPATQATDETHYFDLEIRDVEDWYNMEDYNYNVIRLYGINYKLLVPLIELFEKNGLYVTTFHKKTEN